MHIAEMIRSHPDVEGGIADQLMRCIEMCLDCAQTCMSCADACLAEAGVAQLRQCIRLNLDCADICAATGFMASRRTGSNPALVRMMIETCAEACRMCKEECERHADMHEHCRICAEACAECERACDAARMQVH